MSSRYFSSYWSPPRGTMDLIVGFIDRCEETIDVCVYSLTHDAAAEALIRAHNRGVKVRVITDALQASNRYADDEKLEQAGIPLRRDARSGSMHHKFVVGDGKALGTGSFNWTKSADERNRESFYIVRLQYACDEASAVFQQLWEELTPEEV